MELFLQATVLSWNLDLLKNKVQNQIMIQNPQKVRYFQSGNCFGKLASNSLQKICQNAEIVLRSFRNNDSRFYSDFFPGFSYEKEEVFFSSFVLVCGSTQSSLGAFETIF